MLRASQPPDGERRHPRGPASVVALVALIAAALPGALAIASGDGSSSRDSIRATATAFSNPIIPLRGDYTTDHGNTGADPWIVRYHGFYYLTHSANEGLADSTGGVVIRQSRTLAGLTDAPEHLVERGSEEPDNRAHDFWAPEFHLLRGPDGVHWYLYHSATDGNLANHRMQVLESTGSSPLGPYRWKAQLDFGAEQWSIDPTVFEVRGQLYMIYSGTAPGEPYRPIVDPQSLYLVALKNPWTTKGKAMMISAPTLPWEREVAPINEGPEVLRHGDKLNVIYSASSCLSEAYKLGRLTVPLGADLLDPETWADAKAPEPVFQSSPENGVYGPGHNSFFTSPDGSESWIVYHATDKPGIGCFGGLRTARAQQFTWNRDGTPNFGEPLPTGTPLRAPAGDGSLTRQAELASVAASSGDRHELVANAGVSGGRATRFHADAPGDFVTYAVQLPRACRKAGKEIDYRLYARLEVGPDHGITALSVVDRDGSETDLGKPIYTYAPGSAYAEFPVGRVSLPAGRARFTFEVRGQNPTATGATIGVDQLRFVPRCWQ